jgi:hypothetical protein
MTPDTSRKGDATLLCAQLAAGSTLRDAAAASGISERTARRRLKDPDIQETLQRLIDERSAAVTAELVTLGRRAVATLARIMDNPLASDTARTRAAHIVLTLALRYQDHSVERRLATLEQSRLERVHVVVADRERIGERGVVDGHVERDDASEHVLHEHQFAEATGRLRAAADDAVGPVTVEHGRRRHSGAKRKRVDVHPVPMADHLAHELVAHHDVLVGPAVPQTGVVVGDRLGMVHEVDIRCADRAAEHPQQELPWARRRVSGLSCLQRSASQHRRSHVRPPFENGVPKNRTLDFLARPGNHGGGTDDDRTELSRGALRYG